MAGFDTTLEALPGMNIRTTLLQPINCSNCRMSALCMPLALNSSEMELLEVVVKQNQPTHKGESVFHGGDSFEGIYAIRSGAIKTYCISSGGQEQITGFHLPGELFGWDGLYSQRHTNTAVALETSALCSIPYTKLESLARTIPDLQRYLMQLMSKEIGHDHQMITLLSKSSAEERVASFLVNLSDRLKRQRLSPTTFRLPMSRAEIGNYLGLTVETVSRVFTRFQKQQLISADKKEVNILDLTGLRDLALACNDL